MENPTPYQKLAANLAYLRKRGASPERQKQEIEKFKLSQDAKTKAERALSGIEKVGGFASKMGSGATFGLLDEAVGLFDEDAKHEQRFLQQQFAEENPKLAFGAEVLGSIAVPGTFLKPAARTASMGMKAAKVLGEGAIQGGLSGLGNAEGDLIERAGETARGATAGAVASGVIGGAARIASKTAGNVMDRFGKRAPSRLRTMERIADDLPDEDIAAARTRLGELSGRRLADEAMVADVIPQGEGALRQAATSNHDVRKAVDSELRKRMNRLANRADDRFSEYTGTQPRSAAKSIEQLDDEAAERARPLYRAAQDEAAGAPKVDRLSPENRAQLAEMGGKAPEGDAIDEALSLPYVRQRIAALRSEPRSKWVNAADDDHALLDRVYKDIGRKFRSLDPRADWELRDDLFKQRAILAEAITSRAPSYRQALSEFADPMARKDAFSAGMERDAADMIPSRMKGMDAAETGAFKEGKAALLRRDVPNIDVGEFARFQDVLGPIATKEKAAAFKATFGDDAYREYVKDLLEMAGLQRMKAGGGESTTVDKMLEQLQADPEAITGLIAQVLRGDGRSILAHFASPATMTGRALDRLRTSKSAQQRADFLMQRGEDKVQKALDLLERLRKEGKLPRPRDFRRPNPRAAAARTAGSYAGRP